MSPKHSRIFLLMSAAAVAAVPVILAQSRIPTPVRNPQRQALQAPAPVTPMRQPSDLIRKQEPLKVNQKLIRQTSPDQLHIIVSLPKQRAYLMQADQVVIDSPISSGKRGHTSPSGQFTVLEKDPNHHSTLYGDFVDRSGRVVRAGVSARIDAAPSGTHFAGASMKWFMRLTGEGVGMHVGFLPGYPASHGCIRMPEEGAKLFYDHVKVGTPVSVGE
jgi:lipoprotein-anchoring transpeptidase ErfK/SrfK